MDLLQKTSALSASNFNFQSLKIGILKYKNVVLAIDNKASG